MTEESTPVQDIFVRMPRFLVLETISGICLTYSSFQCKQCKMHI